MAVREWEWRRESGREWEGEGGWESSIKASSIKASSIEAPSVASSPIGWSDTPRWACCNVIHSDPISLIPAASSNSRLLGVSPNKNKRALSLHSSGGGASLLVGCVQIAGPRRDVGDSELLSGSGGSVGALTGAAVGFAVGSRVGRGSSGGAVAFVVGTLR
jgi:hypothetical protein